MYSVRIKCPSVLYSKRKGYHISYGTRVSNFEGTDTNNLAY